MIRELSTRRGFLRVALLAWPCLASSAHAEVACAGAMDGSVLQPLATPTVVSFDTPVNDYANRDLMQRFIAGLQRAGVATAGDRQGNTVLSMTFTVTPATGGGAGPAAGTYSNFRWTSGETAPGAGQYTIRGATLSLSAEATDAASQSLAWVGTLSCRIMVEDPSVLAEKSWKHRRRFDQKIHGTIILDLLPR